MKSLTEYLKHCMPLKEYLLQVEGRCSTIYERADERSRFKKNMKGMMSTVVAHWCMLIYMLIKNDYKPHHGKFDHWKGEVINKTLDALMEYSPHWDINTAVDEVLYKELHLNGIRNVKKLTKRKISKEAAINNEKILNEAYENFMSYGLEKLSGFLRMMRNEKTERHISNYINANF